jgi:poly-gamma-glutamate capsule biosynthesis protein CapA/YwtB (metallophosphatase superfamily)
MSNSKVNISFLGDVSLNEKYIAFNEQGINPFSKIVSLLHEVDYVVGNLECMIKGNMSENKLKNPILTTKIETLNYLKTLNLSVACLAHNHVFDYQEDGFEKMTQFLDQSRIKYVGASCNKEKSLDPIFLSKNGIRIGLFNYVTLDTNPNIPLGAKINLNIFNLKSATAEIKALKAFVDHVVISFHWGGSMEGSMYPDKYQPILAKKLINAGADLIIGHHSHTLQPYEVYNGKYIFYSLGNFCFSDFHYKGKLLTIDKKRMCQSIILNASFAKNSYTINYQSIINHDGFIIPINKKIKMIRSEINILYNSPLWYAYLFYEKSLYPTIAYFFLYNKNPFKQLYRLLRKLAQLF